MNHSIRKIPYGVAEFASIRKNRMYYVDKTRFIPVLESAGRYVFFVRPRRFGKSLWMSTLQYYYDINDKDDFETLFKGAYIFDHPTPERHSYLIMSFNFAGVNPDIRHVEASFEDLGKAVADDFLERYHAFFDENARREIANAPGAEGRLRRIFIFAARKKLKIYLFVDEYDNFANTVLTGSGSGAYEKLTHGEGFFRFFFNMLKTATSDKGSGIDRLFVTGVSPIAMDDVTSGMNIGDNISLNPLFNELAGFSEKEAADMLSYYLADLGLDGDVSFFLDIMKKWHGRYRFSPGAENRVFNPDMVLYFIKELRAGKQLPLNMADPNIKIDYRKLRHMMMADRRLNGNFSRLKRILEDGFIACKIQPSFPLERLTDQNNFVSLLYYFGLLTIDSSKGPRQTLSIPNQTVKMIMYEYFREAMSDSGVFGIDLWAFADLMDDMVYEGRWRPVFDFIADAIEKQTSVRDYLEGERAVQIFMPAYLSMTDYYITWTEREMKKGYADLFLEPFLAKFPDMRFGYLIELKYIPRGEFSDQTLQEKIKEAAAQLQKYSDDDRLKKISGGYELKKLALIYHGWEPAHASEVGD